MLIVMIDFYVKVSLEDGVEVWLLKLKNGVEETLKNMLSNIIQDVNSNQPLEDMVFKVCRYLITVKHVTVL